MLQLPICANCKREMSCAKNEFLVKDEAKGNSPATVRYGDLYKCPDCGAQIVTGFGKPISAADALDDLFEALEFKR